jgi:hypothetical protein
MATQNKLFDSSRFHLPNILWLLGAVYNFLAFFSIPFGVSSGLDPSWTYAISKAFTEKLIFGKDIIFTYGPLGYLIHGAVIQETFWPIFIFRFLVYFVFFAVTLIRILTIKNFIIRLSLGLSILFICLKDLSTDSQILVIFLTLLSFKDLWEIKYAKFLPLCLGAFSGICLLTKFTLGIYLFGSLNLFLLVKLYDSIKSKTKIKESSFALIEALLSAISLAFIFFHPNYYIANFTKISLLFLASVIVAAIAILQRRQKSSTSNNLFLSRISFYFCYFLGLLFLVNNSTLSLIAYLRGSWEISSGYSSAMSLIGSVWELLLGISQLILIIIVLYSIAKKGSLGFAISLAFVMFLSFKHGFVRQDEHIFIFFSLTPILVALSMTQVKRNLKKIFIFTYIYTLLVYLILSPSAILLNIISPQQIARNTTHLLNLNQLKKQIIVDSEVALSPMKLPKELLNLVKNKPIDIVHWEISLVAANNLNWKPRPIFQSYSAYTNFLDAKNSQSLLSFPRDYIIYHFNSIDGKHPFFDEPETFFNIFCNYKLSDQIPKLISQNNYHFMLLEKRSSNICSQNVPSQNVLIPWNTSYGLDANDGFLIRAAIRIDYSILGKIYKTLFRSPPVMMSVTNMHGETSLYRIIPENANQGLLVSHLPSNDNEALSFFKGQLPNRIKSLSFFTVNPILYKSKIGVRLISVESLDQSLKQETWIDFSQLKNIKFLQPQIGVSGFLDTKNKNNRIKSFKRGAKTINLGGWAFRQSEDGKETWVLITYGSDNKPLAMTKTSFPRPDVAEYFNNSKYTMSGWSVAIGSQDMPQGVHKITAWVYDPDDNVATPIDGIYQIEIK